MDTDRNNSRPRTRRERRGIWWALVLVSLAAILVAGVELTKRIGDYYEKADLPLFAYIQVASTEFVFAGRDVTLTELERANGEKFVRVTYGDKVLDLDVVYPPKHALPTLFDRQREWFGMYFFADRSNMTIRQFEEKIASDEIKPRLAIVTRTPFGVDPPKQPRFESIAREKNESTGEVHTDRFRYDFYEFMRDGTIRHETKRFPESGRSFLRRRVQAELKGLPEPKRADDEIQEYTWEYGAALKVTNRPPAITLEKQALLNAGWTLPVAASGFLLLVVSFFFAIAPPRVTETDRADA